MPFTLSHPAIVIPLMKSKKWFSESGLIAGSIIPDFEYFLRMRKGTSSYSHSLGGLFYFDIPGALVLIFIYHALIKKPFIENLPPFLRERFLLGYNFNFNAFFRKNKMIVLTSIFIGAGLHLMWDFSIHFFSNFYYSPNSFNNSLKNLANEKKYYIIWSLNSFAGFVYIIYIIYKKQRVQTISNNNYLNYWVTVFVITLIITIIRIVVGARLSLDDIVVTICSSVMLGILITSIYFKNRTSTCFSHLLP